MSQIDNLSKRKTLQDIIDNCNSVYVVEEEENEITQGQNLSSFLGGASMYKSDFEIFEEENLICLKIKEKEIIINKTGTCKNIVFFDTYKKRYKLICEVYQEELLQGVKYKFQSIIFKL